MLFRSAHILKELKKKRGYLILQHKGYQSGPTVLVTVHNSSLAIDSPVDWPGKAKKVKVLFRDSYKVWNYFITSVISESQDTLKMAFPVEIFRMQRRANFRVQMPSICKTSFTYHEEQFDDLTVHNLSLGGMLVEMPKGKVIDDAAHLGNIVITLQDKNKAGDKKDIPGILISTGLAVRSLEVENNRKIGRASCRERV